MYSSLVLFPWMNPSYSSIILAKKKSGKLVGIKIIDSQSQKQKGALILAKFDGIKLNESIILLTSRGILIYLATFTYFHSS